MASRSRVASVFDRRVDGDREVTAVWENHRSSTDNVSESETMTGPLDDVLKLSNIAGPVIRLQEIQGALADAMDPLAHAPGIPVNEVLNEKRNVRSSFAQRRHLERKHVQPVVQVGSEGLLGDGLLQVAVGGGNHSDIRTNGSSTADALELPLLQHAQQHDLGLRRQFAHLVEEERPAFGQLEAALPPLRGTGERPFFVAEQLGRDERRRTWRHSSR